MNSNFLQTKGDGGTIIGVDKSPFGEILICIESPKSKDWKDFLQKNPERLKK